MVLAALFGMVVGFFIYQIKVRVVLISVQDGHNSKISGTHLQIRS